jgi:tetratricopeptide (TPR) repeat protein
MAALALRPRFAGAHLSLANVYWFQGKLDAAIAENHEAIRLKPDFFVAYNGLGLVLAEQGKLDEAVDAFREAIRIQSDYAMAHCNLGNTLRRLGKPDEAILEFRESIRLAPGYDFAHAGLGFVLAGIGKANEAIVEYREAIRIRPDSFVAHGNLGVVLRSRGEYAEAAAELRKVLELTTDTRLLEMARQDLDKTERWAVLAPRLQSVITGKDRPKSAAESLEFAYLACDRLRVAAGTRLFAEALTADPKLAEERVQWNRYNAACSAALAAAGKGKNEPLLTKSDRIAMRRRAYDWLAADLAAWSSTLRDNPSVDRSQVQQVLRHWKLDTDLASIRDPASLSQFPEPEQKDWQALWGQVDALLHEASGDRPSR